MNKVTLYTEKVKAYVNWFTESTKSGVKASVLGWYSPQLDHYNL